MNVKETTSVAMHGNSFFSATCPMAIPMDVLPEAASFNKDLHFKHTHLQDKLAFVEAQLAGGYVLCVYVLFSLQTLNTKYVKYKKESPWLTPVLDILIIIMLNGHRMLNADPLS